MVQYVHKKIAPRKLKKGMRIMIYQDPQSEVVLDGMATLILKTISAAPTDEMAQEMWFVRFDTGERLDRWIRTK